VTATKAGDTNYLAGTSSAANVVVRKATTSIAYTGSQYTSIGSSLALSARLTAPSGCTGTITYSLNRNPITGEIER